MTRNTLKLLRVVARRRTHHARARVPSDNCTNRLAAPRVYKMLRAKVDSALGDRRQPIARLQRGATHRCDPLGGTADVSPQIVKTAASCFGLLAQFGGHRSMAPRRLSCRLAARAHWGFITGIGVIRLFRSWHSPARPATARRLPDGLRHRTPRGRRNAGHGAVLQLDIVGSFTTLWYQTGFFWRPTQRGDDRTGRRARRISGVLRSLPVFAPTVRAMTGFPCSCVRPRFRWTSYTCRLARVTSRAGSKCIFP